MKRAQVPARLPYSSISPIPLPLLFPPPLPNLPSGDATPRCSAQLLKLPLKRQRVHGFFFFVFVSSTSFWFLCVCFHCFNFFGDGRRRGLGGPRVRWLVVQTMGRKAGAAAASPGGGEASGGVEETLAAFDERVMGENLTPEERLQVCAHSSSFLFLFSALSLSLLSASLRSLLLCLLLSSFALWCARDVGCSGPLLCESRGSARSRGAGLGGDMEASRRGTEAQWVVATQRATANRGPCQHREACAVSSLTTSAFSSPAHRLPSLSATLVTFARAPLWQHKTAISQLTASQNLNTRLEALCRELQERNKTITEARHASPRKGRSHWVFRKVKGSECNTSSLLPCFI